MINALNKKWLLIGGLIGVAVLVTTMIFTIDFINRPKTVEDWTAIADKYYLETDYAQAIVAYQKILEIEPKSMEARSKLAEIYIITKDYDSAVTMLKEMIEIDPAYTEAYRTLQDLYYTLGKMEELETLLTLMRERNLSDHILFGRLNARVVDGFRSLRDDNAGVPEVEMTLIGKNDGVSQPQSASRSQTLKTDANGVVDALLRVGEYRASIDEVSYLPYQANFSIAPDGRTVLPQIALIQKSEETGEVEGYIINSLDGSTVQGASIRIKTKDGGKEVQTSSTGTEGSYSFRVASGYYRVEVSAPGFRDVVEEIPVFGGETANGQNIAMTPFLKDGEIRIVLTWGERPQDLDSHLLGPKSDGKKFHTAYYYKEVKENGVVMANLDLDDTSSYGPETTTIYKAVPGTYSFLVHDYTNGGNGSSTALAHSGVGVKVYIGDKDPAEYYVPPSLVGTVWHVFDIEDGQLRKPATEMQFIPSSYYFDFGQVYPDGEFSEIKQAPSRELLMSRLGLGSDGTIDGFVDKFGLPIGYQSMEQLESDLRTYGDSGEPRRQFEFDNYYVFIGSDREISYISSVAVDDFLYGLNLGDSERSVISKLGITGSMADLMLCKTVEELDALCASRGITLSEHIRENRVVFQIQQGEIGLNYDVHLTDGSSMLSKTVTVYGAGAAYWISFDLEGNLDAWSFGFTN